MRTLANPFGDEKGLYHPLPRVSLEWMNVGQIAWAQRIVEKHHYLHQRVHALSSVEGYRIVLPNANFGFRNTSFNTVGLFLFGRPEAQRCKDWYGDLEGFQEGRYEVTRWQVLNLARVWIHPDFQPGGSCYSAKFLPGFTDRHGRFRSTLASRAIKMACQSIGFDYLMARPPVYPEEPFEIRYLMSYCDTRLHKGTLYEASGFELYETGNTEGIKTWRKRLPVLSQTERAKVVQWSQFNARSIRFRKERADRELAQSQPQMFEDS